MKRSVQVAVAVLVFSLAISVANAGLEEGKAAYVRDDYATAIRELQPLAEQGNAAAQAKLGQILSSGGHGIAADAPEALKWLRKAADQDKSDGQMMLGVMYGTGRGVTPPR